VAGDRRGRDAHGGVGIGFWVWDEWNNLKVDHILIAILVIGIVGLALEQSLIFLARRVSHGAM
jgi:nitrate/nitrite transport system permease protein